MSKDKETAGTASDKDAAKGTEGTGGASQAGTSTSTDGKDAKDSTKDTSGKDGAGARNVSTSARTGAKASKDDAPKAADHGKITHRHHDVRANRTDREAQIARADEHMRRAADDSSDGAKVLADKYEAEEAKYANHDNLPPPTGKAFDTLTPARIDGDGTRHW
jgi:hypothetical protein